MHDVSCATVRHCLPKPSSNYIGPLDLVLLLFMCMHIKSSSTMSLSNPSVRSLGLCLASLLSAAILAGRCLWIHFITCEREAGSFGKPPCLWK